MVGQLIDAAVPSGVAGSGSADVAFDVADAGSAGEMKGAVG